MNKKNSIAIIIVGIVLTLGIVAYSQSGAYNNDGPKVVVYKSPNCGCCTQHSAYMRQKGFSVDVKIINDIDSIKKKFKIARNMQSCHTTVLGDYFVEGHVPVEAINKLLTEKPAIDGISLPEMPSGSPGMPGPKLGPFTIYQLKNGKHSVYTTI